jgi:hypothetical protein
MYKIVKIKKIPGMSRSVQTFDWYTHTTFSNAVVAKHVVAFLISPLLLPRVRHDSVHSISAGRPERTLSL